MFVAADFVLGIVCALLTDFETLCVGFGLVTTDLLDVKIGKFWKILNYNFQSRRQIMAARGVYGTVLIGPKSAAHFR